MKKLLPILSCISFLLVSCTAKNDRLHSNAQVYIDSQQYRLAINAIDKIVHQRKLDASYFWALKEGIKVSLYETKDYKRTLRYLDLIAIDSSDFNEIITSQKTKAEIYFNDFQNYQQSIVEYEKLALISKEPHDRVESFLYIARSYFYLNQFRDAEIVISTLLKNSPSLEQKFYAYQLLGNVKLALRDYNGSEFIFTQLLKEQPEKATAENVFLSLAVVYEENNQIDKAISTLEFYKDKYTPREYIELRIKRLLARKRNMPGAKGLRK